MVPAIFLHNIGKPSLLWNSNFSECILITFSFLDILPLLMLILIVLSFQKLSISIQILITPLFLSNSCPYARWNLLMQLPVWYPKLISVIAVTGDRSSTVCLSQHRIRLAGKGHFHGKDLGSL